MTTIGVFAASAQAGLLKGDPRRCSYGARTACARAAALATAKQALARHDGVHPWQGTIDCLSDGGLLRWTCRTFHLGDSLTLTVRFQATAHGWTRRVSFAV